MRVPSYSLVYAFDMFRHSLLTQLIGCRCIVSHTRCIYAIKGEGEPLNDAPAISSPTAPGIPSTMSKEEIEKLFYQVAGADGEIDWQELKRLLDQIMKDGELDKIGIPIASLHIISLYSPSRVLKAGVCGSRGESAVRFE